MSMTTSPGPATGSGTSSQRSTSGSPGSVMTTACMCASLLFGASLPVVASGSLHAAVTTERDQTCALSIEIWADMTYASYRSVSTPYSPAREEPKGDERDYTS